MARVVVIICREDGSRTLRRMTRRDFKEGITGLSDTSGKPLTFAEPKDIQDLNKFVGALLITGDIVKPKPVETVTRYEL